MPNLPRRKIRTILGERINEELPLITLRDTVVFPQIGTPIMIKRPKSLQAIDFAIHHGRTAVFVAQKRKEIEHPKPDDLYQVGTASKIREVIKISKGALRVVVEGVERVKIKEFTQIEPFMKAKIEILPRISGPRTEQTEALMYSILNQFKECVTLGAGVPLDALFIILNIKDPSKLADLVVFNMNFKVKDAQNILEATNIKDKLERLSRALLEQVKILRMAKQIRTETDRKLTKMQKEVFLREQLHSIEKELGISSEKGETAESRKKIKEAGMPKETEEKTLKELSRLERMPSFSPEVSYIRTYLDWIINLPWKKKSPNNIDIRQAEKILDKDHYGLKKVKERIIEYLAVQKLVGKIKGPILCFVGPPGTGKTSVGQSIARALGRKFFRMSLGGIRDEAEIRGHRRTYVGALPGRIIQGINTVGTKNPVFMLDEIDKVGKDFRGDPSAALLEALDPEQNFSFSDHYLEVPFDLSDVMFITTANILDTVPPALRDRMEVIEFPGYTEEEKFHIAKGFLIPKQLKIHGLDGKNIRITDACIKKIIREYTREAGVRDLERALSSIFRKIAKKITENSTSRKTVSRKKYLVKPGDLHKFLGPAKYHLAITEKKDEIGVTTGLAWTQAGGEIMLVEATLMPGKGKITLTGHMGKVMQESALAAFSYIKSRSKKLGIDKKIFSSFDIHIHVPSGAIPKDGPSAGVAMTCSIASVFTKRPVNRKIAMTGEITLRGRILEIGGVKEKVLAAHRGRVKTIILPKDNEKDLEDIPKNVHKDLKFIFVEHMDEALKKALRQ